MTKTEKTTGCAWPPNVRFIERINGDDVKLTLCPGEHVQHHTGGPHDEGYCVRWTTLEYTEEGQLRCVTDERGRDCDGPHSSYQEFVAEGIEDGFVAWSPCGGHRRDYFAESMGY
jgi:hypothetical protein